MRASPSRRNDDVSVTASRYEASDSRDRQLARNACEYYSHFSLLSAQRVISRRRWKTAATRGDDWRREASALDTWKGASSAQRDSLSAPCSGRSSWRTTMCRSTEIESTECRLASPELRARASRRLDNYTAACVDWGAARRRQLYEQTRQTFDDEPGIDNRQQPSTSPEYDTYAPRNYTASVTTYTMRIRIVGFSTLGWFYRAMRMHGNNQTDGQTINALCFTSRGKTEITLYRRLYHSI